MKKTIALILALCLLLPVAAGATAPMETPSLENFGTPDVSGVDPRLAQAMEAKKEIESFGADLRLTIGIDMGGIGMNMNMDITLNCTPIALSGSVAMDMLGETMDMEFYVMEEEGREVGYFKESTMSLGDEEPSVSWERSINDSEILMFGQGGGADFAQMIDLSPLKLDEAASSGTETVFTGDLLTSEWNQNMLQFVLLLARAGSAGDPTLEAVLDALTGVTSGLPLTIKISEESGFPTGVILDISEIATPIIMASAMGGRGSLPSELGINCVAHIDLRDINAVPPIKLPPEAAVLRDANITGISGVSDTFWGAGASGN